MGTKEYSPWIEKEDEKMKNQRILALVSALCLGVGLFGGCSGGAENTDNAQGTTQSAQSSGNEEASNGMETAKKGAEQLNVALELFSSTLEPANDWDSWFVMRYGAGATLVRYGQDGSFEPWLAESWEVAEDGLT